MIKHLDQIFKELEESSCQHLSGKEYDQWLTKGDSMKVKDCVGCGFCCIKVPCWVAYEVYSDSDIGNVCPALIWDKELNRYLCQLMINDNNIQKALFAGEGCCANLNTWRQNVIPRREKD